MTRSGRPSPARPRPSWDPAAHANAYRRLAEMDPPVLRLLILELIRLSDETAALALQAGTADTIARADWNALRAAAAREALASAGTSD